MAVGDQWSVRNDRAFRWWPYQLKQTVRAMRPIRDGDFLLTPVVICTDVLTDVPESPQTLDLLNGLNIETLMHAWVWNRPRRKIQMLTVGVVTEETAQWQSRLLLAAAAIQCQLAHELAEPAAATLNAKPDWSAHPVSGPRPQPDDMLRIIEWGLLPEGQKPSHFSQEDMEGLAAQFRAWGLLSYGGAGGASAELPFYGGEAAIMVFLKLLSASESRQPTTQTSLFQCSPTVEHPRLGSGLFTLLRTPLGHSDDIEWTKRFAAYLNLRWRDRHLTFPRLGAWCVDPSLSCLSYVMFVPNLVWASGLAAWIGQNFALANHIARSELLRYAVIDPPPGAIIDDSVRVFLQNELGS